MSQELFDPEEVGSIFWLLGSDGAWVTGDHSGVQGDTVETVHVSDFNKLQNLYNDAIFFIKHSCSDQTNRELAAFLKPATGFKGGSMKFVQLAVALDAEGNESLYALSDEGIMYEQTCVHYGPGGTYQGRSITRGRTATSPFWREVYLPFAEPALEEKKLRMLEFEEEA